METGLVPALTQAASRFLYCKLQLGHWQLAPERASALTPARDMEVSLFFSWLLRRNEMGPHAHGLETITAKSGT